MAYNYDPYYDQNYGDTQQAPNFWNQTGPPSIVPSATPAASQQQFDAASGAQASSGATNPFFPNGQFNGDYQGYFNVLFPGGTLTGADLKAKEAELAKAGLKLKTSASGNTAWVVLPDGREVDVIGDYGGRNAKQWQMVGGNAGGGGGDYAVDPSFLAPYTEQFGAPADAALPQFQSPGAFKLPTADEILKDPSYLWEEGRIRDSVQNSASAAGTLNSSGTLDRIMGSVSDFARTNYNNVVNRDFNIWGSNWDHSLQEYGAKTGRATSAYQRAMQEFDQRKNQFFQNQDRPYDKLIGGGSLGARVLD